MAEPGNDSWWRTAVGYQLYPRSFQDSNGDGIGDLEGVISRLDYLNDGTESSLGVDVIWLSPTFPSPLADFGYDVTDYLDVHPEYGTLATMDRLLQECHARGIKVLLDFVPNHTSHQHPWFLESRSARDSGKRSWYVWRDGSPDGSPPNNWQAAFGGAAWTWDRATEQWYLHSFLEEQPDLDWRNPQVVEAMHAVLRFWLNRGVDGFRLDAVGRLLKHPELADNPSNPAWHAGADHFEPRMLESNSRNYQDVFEAMRGIRKVLDEYPGAMAVGEVFGPSAAIGRFYGGEQLDGLHLAFNFHFIENVHGRPTSWSAPVLRSIVAAAERDLPDGAQPCFALGNHDRSRFISRHNHDGRGADRARSAALLLLGLRNAPFVYYGEEIGMADVEILPEQLRDPARIRSNGRDPERTPMQWDGSAGRGFSDATPWLPYGPATINAADQLDDPESLLTLYRRAVWRRKGEPALLDGAYEELGNDPDVFAFCRRTEGVRAMVVAVNTSLEPRTLSLPDRGEIILATHRRIEGPAGDSIELPPLAAVWAALG